MEKYLVKRYQPHKCEIISPNKETTAPQNIPMYANKKIAKQALCVHVLGFGAGAAVTSSSGVEFGFLDIVVSTALSTGKTLDAAMSKTGC